MNVITAIDRRPARVIVHPNPSGGGIHVESYEQVDEIVITDMMGREVQRTKPAESTSMLYINDPGVYIIRLEGPRIRQRLKVVISR